MRWRVVVLAVVFDQIVSVLCIRIIYFQFMSELS